MIRYRIYFEGLVQGVGFRYFVARTAELHGITGFVRNLYDGRVELEAQGGEEQLAEFLGVVRQGSRYSEISHMSIENIAVHPHERTFAITG